MNSLWNVVFLFCTTTAITISYGSTESNPPKKYHISFLQAPVTTLDPVLALDTNTQVVLNNAFDGLVSWDQEYGIQGSLADSWRISDDGLVYTFQLRKSALFQDGTPVTAKAVAASLSYLLREESYFRNHFEIVSSVAAEGTSKVVLRLKRRYSELLLLLSGVGAKIVKRPRGKAIVGSGPFLPMLSERGVVLKRVHSFWGKKPNLDEIRFEQISEKEAITRALGNRIDDISLLLLASNEIPANHGQTHLQPMWATWIVGMDQRVPPFDLLEVRREVVTRLSSEQFVKEFYPDNEPATGVIPFGIRGFIEGSGGRSPLTPSSRNAVPETSIDIFVPSVLARGNEIGRWIEKAFAGSRLHVRAVPKPFDWMIANYAKGAMGAYLLSINAEFPDPSFIVRSLRSTSESNFLGTHDSGLDRLIAELENENGSEKRSLAQQINSKLKQMFASANLMHVRHRIWTRSCVSGLRPSPVSEGYTNYREVVNTCH